MCICGCFIKYLKRLKAVIVNFTLLNKSKQIKEYAEALNIIGTPLISVGETLKRFNEASTEMGLKFNTKLMCQSRKQANCLGQTDLTNSCSFQVIREFWYLGSTLSTH